MGNLFAGPHIWIILLIILLLFGAAKLPALAKSLGQSARVFKGEMKGMKDDDVSTKAEAQTVRAPLEPPTPQPQPQPPVTPQAAETANKPHTPPSAAS